MWQLGLLETTTTKPNKEQETKGCLRWKSMLVNCTSDTSTTTNNGANPASGMVFDLKENQDGTPIQPVEVHVEYEQGGKKQRANLGNPSPASGTVFEGKKSEHWLNWNDGQGRIAGSKPIYQSYYWGTGNAISGYLDLSMSINYNKGIVTDEIGMVDFL